VPDDNYKIGSTGSIVVDKTLKVDGIGITALAG
jgi:hypothetical protein